MEGTREGPDGTVGGGHVSVEDDRSEIATGRDLEDGPDRPRKETGVVLQDRVDGNQETEKVGQEMADSAVRYPGETERRSGRVSEMDQETRIPGIAEKRLCTPVRLS